MRILVADDDRVAREALSELLALAGHDVYRAADGRQALDVAARARLDVAILDIDMPGYSGWELAARMRGMGWRRPVRLVALSGRAQPADRAASANAGFHVHLVKPASFDDIARALT